MAFQVFSLSLKYKKGKKSHGTKNKVALFLIFKTFMYKNTLILRPIKTYTS